MLAQVLSIRAQEDGAAVERAAFAFDDTNDQVDIVIAGNLGKPVAPRPRDVNRTVIVALEIPAALASPPAHARSKVEALQVARHEDLGKDH